MGRVKASVIKNEYMYLIWAFIVPMLLMWMIYIAMEVYPFGKNSVLVLDLNGQYVYFYEELRAKILEGGSLLYSWGRALGGEFMGIFAYYIASPFAFLVALFPKDHITEALLTIILLKTGSMGLTMGLYLHNTRPKNKVSIIMFSSMYALSAYAVVHAHNTMWIDNLILLPLVAMGIEQLITKRKFALFTVTVSMALMTNFYIGYMTCIFVIIYFFYYYFAHSDNNENNFYLETNHFWKSFARIAVYSIIAIAISAIIVLPAYTSLQFGKNTFSNPKFNIEQRFDFLDMIVKMLPGSYDTVRPEGLPFLYCGTLALILVPIYFITSRIKVKERVMSGVLIGIFVLSFNISAIDMVWHGFQKPNWLNYRYSFMLIFIFIVLAYKAFEYLPNLDFKYVVVVCGILGVIVMFVQKLEYDYLDDFSCIWFTLACLVIYVVALYMEHKGTAHYSNATAILAIMVCLELYLAGLLNTIALDDDVVISSRTSYNSFMEKVQPTVDYIQELDTSPFYRLDKNFHRKTNDPMALGYYGISNSTSTLNASVIKVLDSFGYTSKSHWAKYLGGTAVSDAMLGIKYVISNKTIEDYVSEAIYEDTDNNYTVYYNPYTLSLAYAVNGRVNNIKQDDYNTPFEFMNALATDMLGSNTDVRLFEALEVTSTTYDNCDVSFTTGHKKYTPINSAANCRINYIISVPAGVEAYMYVPSDYKREFDYKVNGTSSSSGTVFGSEANHIISLGSYDEATEITVTFTLKDDVLYIMSNESLFYYLDSNLYKEVMPILAEGNYEISSFEDTHIEGTITIPEGRQTLFTSIPYDSGWHVYVDGKEYETYMTLQSLLAVDIPAGEHELTFDYSPDCYVAGAALSVMGLIGFAGAIVINAVVNKRRRKKWHEINAELLISAKSESSAE